MDRESITIQMDGDKAGRLRELAGATYMTIGDYCAWVLDLHIMRKAGIDANGATP